MRTETDKFDCNIDEDGWLYGIFVEITDKVVLETQHDCVNLTKDQAREFALQLLEICGEEG